MTERRHGGRAPDVVAGEDPFSVDRNAQRARTRAGADDQVVAGNIRFAALAAHVNLSRPGDRAVTIDDRDFVLFHQELDALPVLGDHLLAILLNPGEVVADVADGDPEGVGMLHLGVDVRALEIRLAGDAAAVETGAAKFVPLDHGDVHAELRGPNRADIAARATAQEHNMECCSVMYVSSSPGQHPW